jgi:transposase
VTLEKPPESAASDPLTSTRALLAAMNELVEDLIRLAAERGAPKQLLAPFTAQRGGRPREIYARLYKQLSQPGLSPKTIDYLFQVATSDLAQIARRMSEGGSAASKARHQKNRPKVEAKRLRMEKIARTLNAAGYTTAEILSEICRKEGVKPSVAKKNPKVRAQLPASRRNSRG